MATFSPTDAAFEGFRIMRDKPGAVAAWGVLNLVISLAMTFGGGRLTDLVEQLEAVEDQDPAVSLALLSQNAPLFAVVLIGALVLLGVYSAAVYRVTLRPQEKGLGYLRLGKDELRLAMLMFIFALLAIGMVFAVTLAAGMLAAAAAAVAGPLGALVGILIGLGSLALFALVAVRLSLAGPMTFAERRLRVFASWRVTRGNFWRLLGAYVLATVMAVLLVLFGLIVYAVIALIATGGDMAAVGAALAGPGAATEFTIAMLISAVVAAFLGAVQNAVLYAPGAVAYRELTGAGAAESFE